MTRYTDLYDAMFDALVVDNDQAQEALLALPADQRYVIEVSATADGGGTELRVWHLDLNRAATPVSDSAPGIHRTFVDALPGKATNGQEDAQ